MRSEDLIKGKIYVYKNTKCLVLDHLPSWENGNAYVFVDHLEPQLDIQYLNKEAVNDFITELEIEKDVEFKE